MHSTLNHSIALEGPVRSGKTHFLIQRAITLLQTEPSASVLVLCSNYYRKSQFLEAIQEHLQGCYAQLQVTTYTALVRNTLSLYWPCIETFIQDYQVGGKPVIFPELSGFEASEYLIRKILRTLKQQDDIAFQDFQGSERSLVTQLIRRTRLRSENRLERKEMRRRSELIGENCLDEVDQALLLFDKWCCKLRVFDSSRQIDLFHYLLEHNSDIQHYFQHRIQHLIVDDVDETIPAQQHFIKFLAPTLKTLTIAADIQGGTRRGYLNAYPYDWEGLKKLKPDMETLQLKRTDTFYTIGDQLLKNWIQAEDLKDIAPLPATGQISWRPPALGRMEMINQMVSDVIQLLQSEATELGHHPIGPEDIVIVMPKVDTLARLQIQQQFQCRGIPFQVLTGTQRPTDNPICRSLLLLLQLINKEAWQMPLSSVELKGILRHALKLHHLDAEGLETLVSAYRNNLQSAEAALPPGDCLTEKALQRYNQLLSWLEKYRDESLEEQLYSAFNDVISPQLTPNDELADLQQLTRSLYIQHISLALQGHHTNPSQAAKEWFIQAKTGVISDTPNKPTEINTQAIVLGTPQKIIDFEIERRIHLWLDVSSREWSRTDNAPLYNAWVHSAIWDGNTDQASDAFNQLLTRTRAGHITRTLMLYVGEKVFLYSSDLDNQGNTQNGIFQNMLLLPHPQISGKLERANLRTDQAQVLTYQGGPMAITAVPGAGKTFINVELLLELIERGIPPEKILVLTYMDSAAKTLLSRLKSKLMGISNMLPMVSTIHSLAFRIITEDDHAVYLGLDSNHLDIVDEAQEIALIDPIIRFFDTGKNYIRSPKLALKGIQLAKSYRLTPTDLKTLCSQKGLQEGRIVELTRIYEAYQRLLQTQGKLDFADLITHAITLLEATPEIREKYQNRFHYIIEDEAQDSSLLLQSFIHLLQEKHGNLIRTGDTNQSITTTFTTADTSVFRQFMQQCQETGLIISMNQSSRCAEPIIDLANSFITWACQDTILQQAFQPITMAPVLQKNPPLLEPIQCEIYLLPEQEQASILQNIQQIQAQYPGQSIAVLVRSNPEVLEWTRYLQAHEIQAISFTDLPDLNPAFLLVVRILRVLENPSDLEETQVLFQQLSQFGILSGLIDTTEVQNIFSLGPHQIHNGKLLQLYYNFQDMMRYAFGQDICHLIVRLSDMFLLEPQHRSIGYLCAIKAQEWVDQLTQIQGLDQSPLELVNREFEACLRQKRLPFKSIQDTSVSSQAVKNRFVQIMTLHKSKGQEFDFVFIPGMTEKNFSSLPEAIDKYKKWQDSDKLELELDRIRLNTQEELEKRIAEKKLKKIEEEARLVYVGLTRSKQGLYLSCSLQGTDWRGKPEAQEPSRYLKALEAILSPTPQNATDEEALSHA